MILNKRQIARFCTQLQMLLSSGVPLLEALSIAGHTLRGKRGGEIIRRVSDGESLADAMRGLFPPMVTSSVESAERVGKLEEALGRLSQYYENRAEVEEKIKSALIYPVFVVMLCICSLVVLFAFVLPGFKSMFADLGTELPFFSRVIIGMGDLFSSAWPAAALIILAASAFLLRYRRTEKGALNIDGWMLKIKYLSRGQIIQGFRTAGALMSGGISIVESLAAAASSSRNRAFKGVILNIKSAIEEGEKLSDSLAGQGLFPKELVQMVAVGENSGKLGEMLVSISEFYEKERELLIKRATSLLEPALTLAVGIVVGIIAISMFLPMIDMISKLQ